jgi:AraC-like DNA-binding protein
MLRRAMLLKPATFRSLCEARDLICALDDDPLSVRVVAQRVQISRFHFIRQFEALFGVTPHQLRIQARLDRAKQLLARGQHSVTEVCMELGFSSLGSFSGSFARRVGETPSAYRRRMRTLIQMPGGLSSGLMPGCFSLMGHLPPSAFRNFREA